MENFGIKIYVWIIFQYFVHSQQNLLCPFVKRKHVIEENILFQESMLEQHSQGENSMHGLYIYLCAFVISVDIKDRVSTTISDAKQWR